jgi:hypothetical protein
MVVGAVLVVCAAGVGWVVGRFSSLLPVRLVTWWVKRVIVPLVRSRSWWRRATAIFVNNTVVLGVVLAAGFHLVLSVVAAVGLGVSLGIGLRVLSEQTDTLSLLLDDTDARARWRIRIGMALNLLEPPAILLTLGLSLGLTSTSLTPGAAWETFAVWVVPLLAVAGGGEGLWIGAGSGEMRSIGGPDSPSVESGASPQLPDSGPDACSRP